MISYKKKIGVALLDVFLLCLLFLTKYATKWMITAIPDCVFASNGWKCPACGGTRSVNALVQGDFSSALAYNPFVFFLIAYLGITILALNVEVLFTTRCTESIRKRLTHHHTIIAIAICFAIFGIVRNII